jgi:hypothetical protein
LSGRFTAPFCRQSGTLARWRASWNPLRSLIELSVHSMKTHVERLVVNIIDAARQLTRECQQRLQKAASLCDVDLYVSRQFCGSMEW